MSQPPVRFAMIGAGAIAQAYALALEGMVDAAVVAVADPQPAAAEALAGNLHARVFRSHLDLTANVEIDAALICTPPSTHAEVYRDLVARGAAVLCEKPLSTDAASARQMIDTSRRAKALLTMASKFRFVDDVVRAKALVASGVIGDIVLIENVFMSHVDMSKRWNSNSAISGGGVLIDNGTHSADLVRYFVGPLTEIHVLEGKRLQNLAVEETVHMFVRSASGILGTVDLSWSINKEQDSYLRIYGSTGAISVGWKESRVMLAGSGEWQVFGRGYDKNAAIRNQLNNFVQAIRGKETPRVTLDDALASVDVIEAGYASLRAGRWLPIPSCSIGEQFGEIGMAPPNHDVV